MADIPIQLRYSTNFAGVPSTAPLGPGPLQIGETAWVVAAGGTRIWVGDNALTPHNRLLLTTGLAADATDAVSWYLKGSGGALTGALTTTRTTFADDELVTKDFVDHAVAAGAGYRGTFDPSSAADINAINAATKANGYYWMAEIAGNTPSPTPVLPGIAPNTPFNPGDQIVWNDTSGTFTKIAAGGLTQTDADARYVRLAADSTMTSTLFLTGTQTAATAATTRGYVDGAFLSLSGGTVNGTITANNLISNSGVQINDLTTGAGHPQWSVYAWNGSLHLDTATTTGTHFSLDDAGDLTLAGNMTIGSQATTRYLDVYGHIWSHGADAQIIFNSEDDPTNANNSAWDWWAAGDAAASRAELSCGFTNGPGPDEPRLTVRSNGAVEVGTTTFTNAHIECFGTVKTSGTNASFTYMSEDDPTVDQSEWYMWAIGTATGPLADNWATVFAPYDGVPRFWLRADGRLVLGAQPRTGTTATTGAMDAVPRSGVDAAITRISGGTF